jgi:hypothetical protein
MTPIVINARSRSARSQRMTDGRLMGGSREQGDRLGSGANNVYRPSAGGVFDVGRFAPPGDLAPFAESTPDVMSGARNDLGT